MPKNSVSIIQSSHLLMVALDRQDRTDLGKYMFGIVNFKKCSQ